MMPGGPQMARVTGTVVTTNPLVVMLPGNLKVAVNAAPTTRVAKISRMTLAELKVGDSVRAAGRPDEMGNFAATRLDVGMELGPGGGFGAPGGPVPVPRPPGQF
jgi:hypothetical protein